MQRGYEEAIQDAERYITELLAVTRTPGLNLAVAHGQDIIWTAGYGLSDLRRRTPMSAGTVTRAASISKLYTAVAIMQLVERGVVDIYSPVDRWLPDIGLSNPLGERAITPYDLLTFRSGLAVDTTDAQATEPAPLEAHLSSRLTTRRLREYGGVMPLWGDKVGARHQYSNLGIAALGLIVERANVEGILFTEYVDRSIIAPLGMQRTILPRVPARSQVPEHIWDNVSTGYAGFGEVLIRSPWLHGASYPSSGLLTTPEDHVRLLLALRDGTYRGTRVLGSRTVDWMRTPQVPLGHALMPSDWHAALGLVVADRGSDLEHYGHGGSQMWGWWNEARVYPRLDLSVVVATNHWDMVNWHNPARRAPAALVIDYVARRFASLGRRAAVPRTLAWKVSYLIGTLMVERTRGFLGADMPPEAHRLASDATASTGGEALALWNIDGFNTGVADMMASGERPQDIREFFASPACKVRPDELRLALVALGSDGPLPAPLAFWSHVDFGDLS